MMTGADAATIRDRLSGLVLPDVLADPHAAERRHAAAVWSCLTEPGDGVAGALVTALGPVEALHLVLGEPSADARFSRARERWLPRRAQVADAFAAARRSGVRLVTPDDDAWPRPLADLGDHAPLCLWVRGDTTVLGDDAPGAAIVGARAATGYGEHVTAELSAQLAADGVVIVSGGAYGIDGAAHRAALTTGGRTIAYLAGGVDRFYPAGHERLLSAITEGGGAVVSEVPCGTSPTKWRFLQRNRLIAAHATATVVVEAGWRSGSLNTAGHAAALGRPLGAVPGPVTSAASAGCHRLIREYDARCVTSAADVRELLGGEPDSVAGGGDRTDDRTRILDALTRTARAAADVARRAGFTVDEAQGILGILELEGLAERADAGWRRAARSQ